MYTVFIADDEITECKALEMMIRNGMRSCKVIGYANNGTDLLKAMEGERPDIAIIDINMPGLTGLEVLEFIRMRNYSTKIVINTAYSDFSYIKKAMKYKVSDYILKPVKREELYSILNGICKQLDEERKQKQKVTRAHSMENQMSEMAKNFFVTSLLLGEFDETSFALLSRSFQLPYLGGCMMVIQLESDGSPVIMKISGWNRFNVFLTLNLKEVWSIFQSAITEEFIIILCRESAEENLKNGLYEKQKLSALIFRNDMDMPCGLVSACGSGNHRNSCLRWKNVGELSIAGTSREYIFMRNRDGKRADIMRRRYSDGGVSLKRNKLAKCLMK